MQAAACLHAARIDAVEELTVQPIKKIEGVVKLPGSKSLSNRALLLAALAEGTTLVKNLLVSGMRRRTRQCAFLTEAMPLQPLHACVLQLGRISMHATCLHQVSPCRL